ncbi:MAG: tRNA uridine-5-carboxymethylaminomethyl(34) synthesis GTPase MnmE [Crocinitomicaceae bacterium]|nr:tRNA uridine-5-carboxymethylaminomethyl(34) synthesis GTPase MnmE [Crocinitomicaceae bacterium]
MNFQNPNDTICALSTASGVGAIALIRLSGKDAVEITNAIFSKNLTTVATHTAHFGRILKDSDLLDEVVVTVYKNPKSFTGEDSVEIACHGSRFIQSEILKLLIEKGARLAGPGEFSLRAFMNGKMDLSQTEAVSDLIMSNSKAAHKVAMHQMRGGFASEINDLRQQLLNFASLVELELDFSQEDVEFADRSQLENLITQIKTKVNRLVESFKLGNVIKNGVPVAIVGPPNAGKSTLLNALLNEEKAIVSEIAGTTRDVIEDTMIIEGIEFRFIDTAGIRETTDRIEIMGIERSYEQIKKASIILLLLDLKGASETSILNQIDHFKSATVLDDQTLIAVFNKADESDASKFPNLLELGIFISAKNQQNLDGLKKQLLHAAGDFASNQNQLIVTNIRHFEILQKCKISLQQVEEGMQNQIPGDLLAQDIRETLYHLGEITGTISNDELLGNIFSKFCIGK